MQIHLLKQDGFVSVLLFYPPSENLTKTISRICLFIRLTDEREKKGE